MFQRASNLLWMALFMTIFILTTMQASTYAPPPAITPSELFTFTFAPNNSIIRSHKLQFLQLNYNSGDNKTDLNIKYFNRTDPNKFKTLSLLNMTGEWIYFYGNKQSLSCTGIIENNTKYIQLIRFDMNNQSLARAFRITEAQFRLKLPISTANQTLDQIKESFAIGDTCTLISLFNKVYRVNPNQSLTLVQATNAQTWIIQASSRSLIYVIVSDKLYRYNKVTNNYDQIYSFPQSYQLYNMQNVQNKLIITAINYQITNSSLTVSLNGTNTTSNASLHVYNQTTFVLLDSPAGIQFIHQFSLKGFERIVPDIEPFTSTSLSKLAIRYRRYVDSLSSQFDSQELIIKSIDYLNMKVMDISFGDAPRFMDVIYGISARNSIFLSDYFFIARNQTMCMSNSSRICSEVCHQFVGDNLLEIGRRNITGTEQINNFQRIFIDEAFTSNSIALSVLKVATGFKVNEINYFNYAAITRILPINFYELLVKGEFSIGQTMRNNLQFSATTYMSKTDVTNITSFRFTPDFSSSSSNFVKHETRLPHGYFQELHASKNCSIIVNLVPNIPIFFLNEILPNQSSSTQVPIIAPELTSLGQIDYKTIIKISSGCQRIMVNKHIFYRQNITNWKLVQNNFTLFSWSSMDQNMIYAIVNSSIWIYDSAIFKYTPYYNSTLPFLPNSRTFHFGNRLAVVTDLVNGSSVNVSVFVFINTANSLRIIFNFTATYFTFPDVYFGDRYLLEISDSLQMLVIGGMVGQSSANVSLKVQVFSINYDTQNSTKLDFPMSAIKQSQVPTVMVSERFLFIKQFRHLDRICSNPTNASVAHEQFVYFYDSSNMAKLIYNSKINNNDGQTWLRAMFKSYPNRTFLLKTSFEKLNGQQYKIMFKNVQLLTERTNLNIQGGFIQNGKVKVCSNGCTSCTSEIQCSECGKLGFVLNTVNKWCVQCAPGCLTCNQNFPTTCLTCFNGTYLTESSCLPCRNPCLTCATNATNCLSCIPGKRFNSGTSLCQNCTLRNCLTCATISTCAVCRPGFVLGGGRCRGCALSCSQCSPANIILCTGCKNGLQLVSGKCVSCPVNCLTCNDQLVCQNCSAGYYAKEGKCVLNCQMPCATCVDNLPNACLSCFGTANLVGSTCQFNSSCNATGSCTSCGESSVSNLYYQNGKCYPCSKTTIIPNCLQCSKQNPLTCSMCSIGYYVNSGSCVSCSSSSISCLSEVVSLACKAGFTLADESTSGQCIACQSPCATCQNSPSGCLTCVEGYTKTTWKCQMNKFVEFRIVFRSATTTTVLQDIDPIVASLLLIVKENSTNTEAITVYNVTAGSSVLTGSVTPSNASIAATSAALATALASGSSVGGQTILSSSIWEVGSSCGSSSCESNINSWMLAVGFVIGLILLGPVIGCLFYWCYIRMKEQASNLDIQSNEAISMQKEQKSISNDPMQVSNDRLQLKFKARKRQRK